MRNFGKIKEVFNNLLSEGIITKDSDKKAKFKSYVAQLRESNILRTQFLVYNNIESKIEESEFKAGEYVKANIQLMDKYTKKEIAKANKKLSEAITMDGDSETSQRVRDLHENIAKLIFTENTPNNIDTIIEATHAIVNYITTNQRRVVSEGTVDLPISLTTSIYVEKFNSKYENMNEDTLKLAKTILESNTEDRKKLLDGLIKECTDLVNTNLKESSIDDKERLLAVKEKLLSMESVEDKYVEDISSLIELKEGLSDGE